MLALSAAEGTIVLSATGGVMLAALIAFGLWWLKPFRSAAKRELRPLEPHEPERRGRDEPE
jgi:cytoskeletal protein RodZ